MATRARAVPITADDLDDFQSDGYRYEVVDGELYVTPAPSVHHQRIVGALYRRLHPYGMTLGLEVLMAPLDVRMAPLTQLEPDLLGLPRTVVQVVPTRWLPLDALTLAVEVLSDSSARVDRGRKRELYMAARVATYWIVDPHAHTVEVWTPDATTPDILRIDDSLPWQPVPDAAPLVIDLGALFGELA